MKKTPKGKLTGAQLELMEVLWSSDRPMTAAEVWAALPESRTAARTTVSTLLQRLTSRGWLMRTGEGRGATYAPAFSREAATNRVAVQLFDELFGGSTRRFVLSLLGSETISSSEAERLRQLLDSIEEDKR